MIAARRLGHARPARLRGASDEMPAYDWRSPARELVAIVEFRILGSVEVTDGGLVRDLGGLRERTLLARLLLSAGQASRPNGWPRICGRASPRRTGWRPCACTSPGSAAPWGTVPRPSPRSPPDS